MTAARRKAAVRVLLELAEWLGSAEPSVMATTTAMRLPPAAAENGVPAPALRTILRPGDKPGDRERRLLDYMAEMRRQGRDASARACRRSAIYESERTGKPRCVDSTRFYQWVHDLLPYTRVQSKAMEELLAGRLPLKYARRLKPDERT